MNVTMKKSEVEEMEMDLTGVCNLSCPLCTRNYQHANHLVEKNVRSIEEIIKQLDEKPKRSKNVKQETSINSTSN